MSSGRVQAHVKAHGVLAVLQLALAIGVHGSLLRLPDISVLALTVAALAVVLLAAKVRRDRHSLAAQQGTIHLTLLLLPLLSGDGLHLSAPHSWWQLGVVAGYAAAMVSLQRLQRGLALQVPRRVACALGSLQVRLFGAPPPTRGRPSRGTQASARRCGGAAQRPLLSTMWFRGPPAGSAAPA